MSEEGTRAERIEAAQPGDIIILPTAPGELTACGKCKWVDERIIAIDYFQSPGMQPVGPTQFYCEAAPVFDWHAGCWHSGGKASGESYPMPECQKVNTDGHCPHFSPA